MNIYDFLAKDISVLINFFFYLFFSFLVFRILISKRINRILFHKKKLINNIQNIHLNNTSRLGGLGIALSFLAIAVYQYYIDENKILLQILICSLPLMVIALTEDLIQNINPVLRLVGIFISPLLCLYIFRGSLPSVEIFIIESFINSPYISPIFFSICLVGFINGTNFIDGTNGLASFTILSSLLCLLFLGVTTNDTESSQIIVYVIAVFFCCM